MEVDCTSNKGQYLWIFRVISAHGWHLSNVTNHFIVRKIFAYQTDIMDLDVLLTVHLSITLVNDQLDAQFFYFIIYLLQSPACFEQRLAHHQEVKLY